MIAIFCVLNAVDAYTTEVGLSNGGREINVISASFIATFGLRDTLSRSWPLHYRSRWCQSSCGGRGTE